MKPVIFIAKYSKKSNKSARAKVHHLVSEAHQL